MAPATEPSLGKEEASIEAATPRESTSVASWADEEMVRIMTETKKSPEELEGLRNRRVKNFYKKQNELIGNLLEPFGGDKGEEDKNPRLVKWALNLSFGVNVCLFLMQVMGAVLTSSLSMASTAVDAFTDLFSGATLLLIMHARKKVNTYKYPTGKARLEAVGLVVFSSFMSALSFQIFIESSRTLATGGSSPDFTWLPLTIIGVAIGSKFLLFLFCVRIPDSPSAAMLAQDHRNDIGLNLTGVCFGLLGQHVLWWLDPFGAILIGILILRSWASSAWENIQLLAGKVAPSEDIKRLIFVSMHHDPRILQVDTCRAFHVGTNLFVEVDIVLDPLMSVREAHDVAESLQEKLESLGNVDRAFVHIDYETTHRPEHKIAH
eukprot:Colp12_sorted_trinity150504_noHs@15144